LTVLKVDIDMRCIGTPARRGDGEVLACCLNSNVTPAEAGVQTRLSRSTYRTRSIGVTATRTPPPASGSSV